jgi:hypothetical protein
MHPFRTRLEGAQPKTLILRTFPYGSRKNAVYHDDGRTSEFEEDLYHRLLIYTEQHDNRFSLNIAREGRRPLPYEQIEWQMPAPIAQSATIDGRDPPLYESPDAFTKAEAGVFQGHHFFRIRTPITVRSVEVSVEPPTVDRSNEPPSTP